MHNQPTFITSFQNPQVKQLKKLKERRSRDESGLYLIEGYREILRAEECKTPLLEIYFCPELFLGTNEKSLLEKLGKRAKLFQLSMPIFEKISYRDRPDGLIAIAKQTLRGSRELREFLKTRSLPFLLIVESIEKPGNLGSILRSADGAGVDGIILCDKCTDLFNPNVVRSSVGTLFSMAVFEVSSEECIAFLKERKIQVIAATPSGDLEFTKADFTKPLAVVVGSEQLGLSRQWMDVADLKVRIPMKGIADSLNVSNAATLLLYEVLRQRE